MFEHRPRLHRLLTLGSRVPILLAILARKDPRSSLTLSRERAAGCVVIQTSTIVTIFGWSDGISLLYSGSLAGARVCNSRSLWRSSEWCRGLAPTVCRLDLVHRCLVVLLVLFFGVSVEYFLLRLHVLDPFWRGYAALWRKAPGLSAPSAPYVGSASGNGSPGLPGFC